MEDDNKRLFTKLLSFGIPIIHIVTVFIMAKRIFHNWRDHYTMIYEAGNSAIYISKISGFICFSLYIALLLIFKSEKKLLHIVLMFIALFVINYFFKHAFSYA